MLRISRILGLSGDRVSTLNYFVKQKTVSKETVFLNSKSKDFINYSVENNNPFSSSLVYYHTKYKTESSSFYYYCSMYYHTS